MERTLALAGAVQKVEHYEIATYGTLRTSAENMGRMNVVKLLRQKLDNEKATAAGLTEVAASAQ